MKANANDKVREMQRRKLEEAAQAGIMPPGAAAGMPGMGGMPMPGDIMGGMPGAAGTSPRPTAGGMPGMGGMPMPGGMPGGIMGGMPGAAGASPRPTMGGMPGMGGAPGMGGMPMPGDIMGGMPGAAGAAPAASIVAPGAPAASALFQPLPSPRPFPPQAGVGLRNPRPTMGGMPGMGGAPGMSGSSGIPVPSPQLPPLNKPTPELLYPSLSPSGLKNLGKDPISLNESHEMGFPRDEIPWAEGAGGSASREPSIPQSRVLEAMATLREYKAGKQRLETRIVENDKWWRMRHGDIRQGEEAAPQVRSAWLLNSVLNKHADAMDNFPQASVLPREEGDKDAAKVLSQVLPVILEQNGFDAVWSDAWFHKLQAGAAVYGVFWNQRKLNGLGDVEVRNIDLLNLFWEPGVRDIQLSRNLFHVEKHPNETLISLYPKLEGKLTGSGFRLAEYDKDDPVDDRKSSLVVDWYYKVLKNGREVLHFCKLCAGEVLYASEDDPACRESGFYAHGKYPFVVDVLFPLKESPAGFGYIDLMKDTQERIDQLGASIVKNARMRATKRFFVRTSGSVNEKEFADWTRELVHTEGALDEASVREITVAPIGGDVMNAYQALIEELKETSGNRDFSQGGTTGGVTAASAIAALQEAGSKLSRDMLKGSYRAFTAVCNMALEVIRQFYDLPRTFRIIAAGGESYVTFDNAAMLLSSQGTDFGTAMGQRLPVFDILVRPQKSNPYSKVAQNEMALEFYRMGFFNPQMADQALSCMEMMDFDGKDQIMARVSEAGGMQKQLQQMQEQMMKLMTVIQSLQAGPMGAPGGMGAGPGGPMGAGPEGPVGPGAPGIGMGPGAPLGPEGADMAAGMGAPPPKKPPQQKGRPADLQAGGLQSIQPADGIAQKARMQAAKRSDPMA